MAAVTGCAKMQTTGTDAPGTDNGSAPVALNIRYIDGDSITANYNLAKDIQEVQIQAMNQLQQLQDQKGAEINRFGQIVQDKYKNNGYLTEASFNADQAKLARMQQEAATLLSAKQREKEAEMLQLQQTLNDSIDNFIRDYNATKGYDAILFRAAGIYFNPALDITDEVIKGLNERYNRIPDAAN